MTREEIGSLLGHEAGNGQPDLLEIPEGCADRDRRQARPDRQHRGLAGADASLAYDEAGERPSTVAGALLRPPLMHVNPPAVPRATMHFILVMNNAAWQGCSIGRSPPCSRLIRMGSGMAVKEIQYRGLTVKAAAFEVMGISRFIVLVSVSRTHARSTDRKEKFFEPPFRRRVLRRSVRGARLRGCLRPGDHRRPRSRSDGRGSLASSSARNTPTTEDCAID